MLDQNTDRMWYVIGAVIVGAAVIFLANGTLPSLFASVTDSFETTSATTTREIDLEFSNLINVHDMTYQHTVSSTNGRVSAGTGAGTLSIYHASTSFMPVVENTSYTAYIKDHLHTTSIAFYNSDKQYISGIQTHSSDELVVQSPNGAAYARMSGRYQTEEGGAPIDTWWFGESRVWNNE